MLRNNPAVHQKPVEAVLSNDYTALIHKGLAHSENIVSDTLYNNQNKTLQFSGGFNTLMPVKEINIYNNKLQIYQSIRKQLTLSGSYTTTLEMINVNRTPALQTQYVQGRPQNGVLAWRGPETVESFSFGLLIQSLKFDGSIYDYDRNGRLTTIGSGNGNKANVYNNSIFHTAFVQSQSFNVNSHLFIDNQPVLIFRVGLGRSAQSTVIRQNTSSANNITTSATATVKKYIITGSYNHSHSLFFNSNRNGFLNRVYQNAMLTPISFDNSQGYSFTNGQRSYSDQADNPYFLLNENGNSDQRSQTNAGLTLEKKQKDFSYTLIQSLEAVRQASNEAYKPSTAYFENGITTQRVQKDKAYAVRANTVYTIPFGNYHYNSVLSANYHFNAERTAIDYSEPHVNYQYQRSSHQASINSNGSYSNRNFGIGFDLANKIYFSNTSSQKNFFLPSVGAYVRFANVLNTIMVKLSSSFNSFNSELPINHSLAYLHLLQYSTQQSFQYFPVQEVSDYDGLAPIHHKEWTGRVEVSYKNRVSLSAETFHKLVFNDIFPGDQNGKLY